MFEIEYDMSQIKLPFFTRLKLSRPFDLKDLKNIEINYNTKEKELLLNLPCLLPNQEDNIQITEKSVLEKKSNEKDRLLDLWKLKRITDQCYIRIDNSSELLKPESNFEYGFASKFRGSIRAFEVYFQLFSMCSMFKC